MPSLVFIRNGVPTRAFYSKIHGVHIIRANFDPYTKREVPPPTEVYFPGHFLETNNPEIISMILEHQDYANTFWEIDPKNVGQLAGLPEFFTFETKYVDGAMTTDRAKPEIIPHTGPKNPPPGIEGEETETEDETETGAEEPPAAAPAVETPAETAAVPTGKRRTTTAKRNGGKRG